MTVNEKTLVANELAVLASDSKKWQARYGNKTLAEVLSKFCDCEDLCSMGVDTEVAVDLKSHVNPKMLARSVKYTKRSEAVVEKPAETKIKKVVIHKKDGCKITRVARGNKMVISHKESDLPAKQSKPATKWVKSKGMLVTKETVKKIISNGRKLEYHYLGDAIPANLTHIVDKGYIL